MQGTGAPPPMSPPYNMAPPIKKQRGGPGDGPPQDAAAQRRAQLQNLRAGYANRPSMGPPPPARGTIPQIGFNPGASAPNNNNKQPQVNGSSSVSMKPAAAAAPVDNNSNHRPLAARPAVPARAPNNTFARQSDIFPSAPKAETPAVARRLDVAFQEPSPPAAVPSLVPEQHPTTPAAPKVSFAASPNTPASISSPEPITSPPPQTPFPATATSNGAATKHAGHTPFPGKAVATTPSPGAASTTSQKTVQFAAGQTPPSKAEPKQQQAAAAGHTPHPKSQQQQGTAGHTPHPTKAKHQQQGTAGHTPHPIKTQQQQVTAGHTPHPKAAAQEVPSTNRREKLAQMRQVADTPPKLAGNENRTTVVSFASPQKEVREEKEEASVELRMQRQMAEEIKKNEQLNRQVAELEEKLAQQATQSAAKVSFMPPASPARSLTPMDRLTSPSKRRAATPHPKREQSDLEEIDMAFLEQATDDVPYKFETEEDGEEGCVAATFTVRRPYGFGDMDQDLWFAAGEKVAKMYKRDATVHKVESIEVAVEISVDESKLLLFNEADVRHQNAVEGTWNRYGNIFERGDALGTVAYIDVDANEKEYSLDKLVEQAIDVRKYYCASLRNMALGLQRWAQEGGGPLTPRGAGPLLASPGSGGLQNSPSVPKTDACVGTEEMPASKGASKNGGGAPQSPPPQAPPPAAPQEPHSDVFSILAGMVSFILYSIVKLPFLAVYTLITWVLVVILGFGIYLLMLNTMGLTGVAPPLHYYHNPPGIM